MKTSVFILLVGLAISYPLSAQTRLDIKTDTLLLKFQNRLNLNNPFGNEKPRLVLPNNKQFHYNPNLAVIPKNNPSIFADPNFRMPVLRPNFQSKMPVLKPDSSIHFHIQIKKIGK